MGCAPVTCFAPNDSAPADTAARETVLLLHGSAGTGALWRHTVAALQPRYRCLAPDLIGYGGSAPWPKHMPLDIAAEQRAVEALLSCCAESFHVVGYSYGGVVALQLALARPERVRRLALIEPVFFSILREAAPPHAFLRFAAVRRDFAAALAQGKPESAMRDFVDFWADDGAWEKLAPAAREGMLKVADKIMLEWEAVFAFAPARESLAALGSRTLLLRGDRSPAAMIDLVDALHAAMPGSRHQVVAGDNHLLPATHAAEVTQAILRHLHAERRQR
jgi:pimeloyl-ACP methyl ester carboxylesterase